MWAVLTGHGFGRRPIVVRRRGERVSPISMVMNTGRRAHL